MAYSHEENSIVERANKEIMRHLRAIIFDRRVLETFSLYLPLVQRIMNVSTHQSTGYSPARLLFNNGVDLDRGTPLQAKPGVSQEVTYDEWVTKMANRNKIVLEVARQTLREHEEVHLMNAPLSITEFPLNSYVLVEHRENNLRRGPSSKLLPFLKGPMRVISRTGSKYDLQDLVSEQIYQYHVKQMFPFDFDPNIHDPYQIALRDDGRLYIVDRIARIRGNPKGKKSELSFEVHWSGFTETTWEPWSQVRRLKKLHDFLKTHKQKAVRDLLPFSFQENEPNPEGDGEE